MDVDAFEAAAAAAPGARDPAAYRAALALYAGDLLPEDRYADWAAARRERLRGVYLGLLGRLARLHETRGEYSQAAEVLRRALDAEPADEGAHAGLMRALALAGEPHQARRQFARLREALRRDLDAEPSPASRRLYEDIVAGRLPPPGAPGDPGDPGDRPGHGRPPGAPATTPPALAPPAPTPPVAQVVPAPPTDEVRESSGWAGTAVRGAPTLPAPLTSFIGRESELAAAQRALAGTRLLTLSGPGGIGKTRLALQVAAAVLPGYGDGVWLVDLAPVAEDAGVAQAIAGVLGVREEPDRPLLETLAGALRSTRLLLVLDDCERVVGGSAAAAEALLRAAPQLQVLATSRQALGVAGETVWRVPPLRLPPCGPPAPPGRGRPRRPEPAGRRPPQGDDRGDSPEGLLRYDAVRLFLERAQASRGAFRLTRQNAPALVAVCRRLDGLPLALELAAARVRVLSVEQLAARLDDRFRLLTRGSRTAPPRQQTLRATVAWSYDLLAAPERRLFERLSVFAGGWTLEAAEQVGADAAPAGPAAPGPQAEGLDSAEVLDLLSQLVDKSLVVVEDEDGGGEVRYRLLETLREFARERLAASGEDAAVRRRHAACYLALAEAAAPELLGAQQAVWLDRLEQELGNFRAALAWCASRGDRPDAAETGMRLAAALWRFWDERFYLSEGCRWLETVLRTCGPAAATTRARVLLGLGRFAAHRCDDTRAASAVRGEPGPGPRGRRCAGDRRRARRPGGVGPLRGGPAPGSPAPRGEPGPGPRGRRCAGDRRRRRQPRPRGPLRRRLRARPLAPRGEPGPGPRGRRCAIRRDGAQQPGGGRPAAGRVRPGAGTRRGEPRPARGRRGSAGDGRGAAQPRPPRVPAG